MWLLFKPKWDGAGWEREKKKLSFRLVPTRPGIENSKKIEKKFKKFKNIIIVSFQAKTCWEMPRKREKIIVPVSSYPTQNREFQESSKKNQKIKKISLWLLFRLKRDEASWEREKKKLSFRSVTTRPRIENSKKNSKKMKKMKKHHYVFISSQNRLGEAEKEEKKIIVPISSYPTWNREF